MSHKSRLLVVLTMLQSYDEAQNQVATARANLKETATIFNTIKAYKGFSGKLDHDQELTVIEYKAEEAYMAVRIAETAVSDAEYSAKGVRDALETAINDLARGRDYDHE